MLRYRGPRGGPSSRKTNFNALYTCACLPGIFFLQLQCCLFSFRGFLRYIITEPLAELAELACLAELAELAPAC